MMRILSLISVCLLSTQVAMANIIINNRDSVGEGFNDPAPHNPIDGNAASTLGQARLNAFRHAALLIDDMISSPVPIRVSAAMNPLPGNASGAVLGGASPIEIFLSFPGAPLANTWYVGALANASAGYDLSSASDDIDAQFNSDIDGDVILGSNHWYYGYERPGAEPLKFVPTVQHEIVHGLGFLTLLNQSGQPFNGYNDAYMLKLEHHGATPADFPSMSDSQRAAAMVDDSKLHWIGPSVRAASGRLSEGRFSDHVWMYAPTTYAPGSSTSHFDIDLNPDELMEPFLTSNPETILAAALLQDIGWTISGNTPSVPQADLLAMAQITSSANPGTSPTSLQITASNNSSTIVPHPTLELVIPANVTITNAQASSGSCVTLATLLRCDLESLAASATGTITLDATVSDGIETPLAFNLSSPLFDTAMSNNEAQVVINPPAVAPDITIADAQAQEGDTGDTSSLIFVVTLSTATNVNISVDYATTENTAISADDYQDTSGTLVIPAGSTTATIPVTLIPDNEIEDDENLSITLSAASSGNITQANATGTILNDDQLSLSVANASVNEGNTGANPVLTFTVTLSITHSANVSVDYMTFDGTATAASDFQFASGTLIIPAGQTSGTIPVTVNGDNSYENNEVLSLVLSNPTSPAILERDTATGTLVNDDPEPEGNVLGGSGGGGGMGLFLVGLIPFLLRRRHLH